MAGIKDRFRRFRKSFHDFFASLGEVGSPNASRNKHRIAAVGFEKQLPLRRGERLGGPQGGRQVVRAVDNGPNLVAGCDGRQGHAEDLLVVAEKSDVHGGRVQGRKGRGSR